MVNTRTKIASSLCQPKRGKGLPRKLLYTLLLIWSHEIIYKSPMCVKLQDLSKLHGLASHQAPDRGIVQTVP